MLKIQEEMLLIYTEELSPPPKLRFKFIESYDYLLTTTKK